MKVLIYAAFPCSFFVPEKNVMWQDAGTVCFGPVYESGLVKTLMGT